MIQRSITSLCLNPDRRLFGGGFCLFLVYLIASMISSRNIVIKKCIYQVNKSIIFSITIACIGLLIHFGKYPFTQCILAKTL